MMIKLTSVVLIMMVLSGCLHRVSSTKIDPSSPVVSQSAQYFTSDPQPTSKPLTTVPPISYLNENQYLDPMQRHLITTINQNAKAINDRKKDAFYKSFADFAVKDPTQVNGIYEFMVNHENEYIIKIDSPRFTPNSNWTDEFSVTVSRTLFLNDSNTIKPDGDSTYYFKQINQEWQLFAID
ncbi:hypothetical protein [Paenibacillus sp. N3.4]|uniref:hypothetical protein n=1 Tax=Paenibacillus sp. N3.4 TaxID=2603222 RepID=UPI0011CC4A6D|nr:hypothetical protein [Paenibacillus sp. N3.4]TXK73848.1 hypothetical protein FU659_30185 [Paenibacillus sp. N3.4]